MEDMNRLGLGSVLGLVRVRVRARVMVRVRVSVMAIAMVALNYGGYEPVTFSSAFGY